MSKKKHKFESKYNNYRNFKTIIYLKTNTRSKLNKNKIVYLLLISYFYPWFPI